MALYTVKKVRKNTFTLEIVKNFTLEIVLFFHFLIKISSIKLKFYK